jgi:hypothetical protein
MQGGRTLKGTPIGEFRHPWVDAYVAVHGDVLSYVPFNIPDFMAYWQGLSNGLIVMGQHPGGMGNRLVSAYPVAAQMHPFLVNFGHAYSGMAAGAGDVLRGYVAANPGDVARNVQPRTNEQWANVGRGNPGGYAPQQINRLIHAHAGLFNYAPADPVDLENFFCALPMAFITMTGHLAANQTWVSAYFPGAENIPSQFYLSWMNTYQYAGAKAYEVLSGYQFTSAADLARHKAGRVNEERADVV